MLKNERNTKTIMPQWIERDCDFTWKKMADDREVLRELWDGRLPIRFSLAPDEVISMEQPDPIYLMVPRQVECWIMISILIPTWNDLCINLYHYHLVFSFSFTDLFSYRQRENRASFCERCGKRADRRNLVGIRRTTAQVALPSRPSLWSLRSRFGASMEFDCAFSGWSVGLFNCTLLPLFLCVGTTLYTHQFSAYMFV